MHKQLGYVVLEVVMEAVQAHAILEKHADALIVGLKLGAVVGVVNKHII